MFDPIFKENGSIIILPTLGSKSIKYEIVYSVRIHLFVFPLLMATQSWRRYVVTSTT